MGDDRDLLPLLCFYTYSESFDLYFKPDPKVTSRRRVWNIRKVKAQLGDDVCHDLLFLHAILGCDATSFRGQAKVCNSPSTVDDIVVAVENALVFLYGGKPD